MKFFKKCCILTLFNTINKNKETKERIYCNENFQHQTGNFLLKKLHFVINLSLIKSN